MCNNLCRTFPKMLNKMKIDFISGRFYAIENDTIV